MTAGNQIVSLDAPEVAPKKRRAKSSPQELEASSSKSTTEFLLEKEVEVIQETNATDTSSSPSDEASGEDRANADASAGAFNPETGEINWDCPCLGGMAYGPCGMQFREAFSCFVFSEEEPKGINCVEKFKAMQDCFRAHPEEYGEEIARDEEDEESFDLDSTSSTAEGELNAEPESVTKSSTSVQ